MMFTHCSVFLLKIVIWILIKEMVIACVFVHFRCVCEVGDNGLYSLNRFICLAKNFSTNDFGILECEEEQKIDSFQANLVEFRVQKGHFLFVPQCYN